MRSQPDLALQRREHDEAVSGGDRLCEWLAYHPRLTCALICGLCLSAGWLDRVMP